MREEGFDVDRYRTRTIMRRLRRLRRLGLKVRQRAAYKVTTKRKHSDQVADNLLNQNVNPVAKDEIWAGDITYLRTNEGWMYLAIVMDLYSRRIVGRHIDKRMTSDLIGRALMMAINLRQPTREHMKQDVTEYIRYDNNDRLHTANGDMSPVKYELSQVKVSGNG